MYGLLADAAVVAHLSYLVVLATGSVVAWRWPWILWLHVPAVAWAIISVAIRVECPLTDVQKWAMRRAGETPYPGGFVDHYLAGSLYPARFEVAVEVGVAALIVGGYAGVWRRSGRPRAHVATA